VERRQLGQRGGAPEGGIGTAAARGYTEKLTFSLAAAASVQLTLVEDLKGRRVGGRCETSLARSAKAHACPKTKQIATATVSGAAGANSFPIPGSAIAKHLAPGHYTLTVTATNASGNSLIPLTFHVP
jgi:hypothetical protein